MEGLVDTEEIKVIDLNASQSAKDAYLLVHEMFKGADRLADLYKGIAERFVVTQGVSIEESYSETDPETLHWLAWHTLDKNCPDGREILFEWVLFGIRCLRVATRDGATIMARGKD